MTSNSRKTSQEENISLDKLPENISVVSTTIDSVNSYNASLVISDHKLSDSSLNDSIITGPPPVTLNIQSASDDDDHVDDDDNKEEPDTAMTGIDKSTSDSNCNVINPSSLPCSDPNMSKLPVSPSVHSLSQKETSNVLCSASPVTKKPILVTSQFEIRDPTKQQIYCQEKDGLVYFISWIDKLVKSSRRISIGKFGAHHDTVVTYDPSTNTFSPKKFICGRSNITYAFGILNFKNRIVLVAGDNPKFLDGSVYLYQLVECQKYQRAFSYKWSEMAKSVRSCSPVVASPTHAVCTTTDDCIMVCQLSNNSDSTLKALSVNVYNEVSDEEDTKWKVVSLNLPAALLNENGHLTSGTVHQKTLYLSIKTSQGFGIIQVSIANVDGLEGSVSLVANTLAFHNVVEELSLAQYSLFSCSDKLLASIVSKHALSSCSVGIVTITDSLVKQNSFDVHQVPAEGAQLHSIISVPKSTMLILVYYCPQLQSYILNGISSVL